MSSSKIHGKTEVNSNYELTFDKRFVEEYSKNILNIGIKHRTSINFPH